MSEPVRQPHRPAPTPDVLERRVRVQELGGRDAQPSKSDAGPKANTNKGSVACYPGSYDPRVGPRDRQPASGPVNVDATVRHDLDLRGSMELVGPHAVNMPA